VIKFKFIDCSSFNNYRNPTNGVRSVANIPLTPFRPDKNCQTKEGDQTLRLVWYCVFQQWGDGW